MKRDSLNQAHARKVAMMDGLRRLNQADVRRAAMMDGLRRLRRAVAHSEAISKQVARTAKATAHLASRLAMFAKASPPLEPVSCLPATTTITRIELADGNLYSRVLGTELTKAALELEANLLSSDRCRLVLTLSNKTEVIIERVQGVVQLFEHGRKVCAEEHEFDIYVADGLEPGETKDVRANLGVLLPPFEKNEGFVKAVLLSAVDHTGHALPSAKRIGFAYLRG